jgi:quercetin dioxygenase-like cupin family protein
MRATIPSQTFVARLALVLVAVAPAAAQVPATAAPAAQTITQGETFRSPSGARLHLILSDANLGPEVSVGEITFPPNADSGDHTHGAIEILYVLSGALEHFVNGKSEILTPGMAGYVKPPDKIRHKTGPAGAKVLVVWVPGEEARKITARWAKEP